MEIIKYTQEKKREWDDFVASSKNGSFLFYRDYMEYHSDRFDDYSLMIYSKNKLVALFPGNNVNDTFYSHQGLTFGGIIHLYANSTADYIEIFNVINAFLNENNIKQVIYKAIPQIYKSHFGDEEYYTMYRIKAELICANLSSVIDFDTTQSISRNRSRNYKKAIQNGLTVVRSDDYSQFWKIMTANMQERFHKQPVHSVEEMVMLHQRFPGNIELWMANNNGEAVAGAVIYKYQNIIKVQYAHASHEGKAIGAIDGIYFRLFEEYQATHQYIDFGTSNTENGTLINDGLLHQKESFGARGVLFNTYRYSTYKTIE